MGLDAVTHLELSRRSGVGRKTIYRHWPTTDDLVHATLDSMNLPHAARTGDLQTDLVAHLEALRGALVDGPLAFVIHALAERSTVQPSLQPVRRRLIEEGCQPIRDILHDAIESGELLTSVDIEQAAGELEGPLFYRVLVLDEAVTASAVTETVTAFLERNRI